MAAQPELIERQQVPATVEPKQIAPAITPMQMLQIAVEKGASLEQLDKLLSLQERWEANEARKAFVVALSAFKAKPPIVTKNKSKTGAGGQYDYASLDEVTGAIAPALAKHGLSHRWTTDQSEAGLIAVTCILTHQMGHSESVTLRGPADNTGSKNAIQAIGSTVSYLQRYTLLAITGLATSDQDDDATGPVEMISAEQAAEIKRRLAETKSDEAVFLKYIGIDKVEAMPLGLYDRAIAAIEKKRKGA